MKEITYIRQLGTKTTSIVTVKKNENMKEMKNIDAMSYDERLKLAGRIYNHRAAMIRRLFPKDSKDADKTAQLVQEYCFVSALAMRLRLDGDIDKAMKYEEMADAAYTLLPNYARW